MEWCRTVHRKLHFAEMKEFQFPRTFFQRPLVFYPNEVLQAKCSKNSIYENSSPEQGQPGRESDFTGATNRFRGMSKSKRPAIYNRVE
jgi:hypothetical protein